ncbi:hypothetical protein M422DRAFT_258091 [Sphaerobolus stellatus SS14]|uniref:Xylanolytic transcriptional activator regulatory domain-containing protein n=1 Tax=Sphaerobolus stellatus (strain SS14) TaxID=990650 RepID=A0A0C9VN64_SPHS4|nr:hypothetical protein M422DRAFT_258091 [Sphaerobolus stellatus SS14]
MVNVARLMGLGRDPDEFVQGGSRGVKEGVVKEEAKGRYTIWKAEMRRRVWWEVFYYDLFKSNSLGLAPLITDDQHTCRLPAEVDDEAFTPKSSVLPLLSPVSALESDVVGTGSSDGVSVGGMGYFIQKCRLAQLVKNMKKLSSPSSSFAHQHHQLSSPMTSSHPNPSHPSSHSTPEAGTLEAATKAENDVHAFLTDLPEGWKLDVDFASASTHILDEQRLLKLSRAPNVDAKPRLTAGIG